MDIVWSFLIEVIWMIIWFAAQYLLVQWSYWQMIQKYVSWLISLFQCVFHHGWHVQMVFHDGSYPHCKWWLMMVTCWLIYDSWVGIITASSCFIMVRSCLMMANYCSKMINSWFVTIYQWWLVMLHGKLLLNRCLISSCSSYSWLTHDPFSSWIELMDWTNYI